MADRTRQTPRAVAPKTTNWTASHLIPGWLVARFKGPGALYNIGNIIALLAGIGVALRDVHNHDEAMAGLHHQFTGSAPAIWLTAAILVFIIAGEVYHRAFHGCASRRAGLNQAADLIAGIAAIALTLALIGFGDPAIAVVAGVILACGKLGSAALPLLRLDRSAHWDRGLRFAVLASRAPSILSLAMSAAVTFRASGGVDDALLPLIMIGCFLLWAWADVLLLRFSRPTA